MSVWNGHRIGSLVCAVSGVLFLVVMAGRADDFASLCADRTAIERVYHDHRTGTKPPFDQILTREALERIVRADQHKEAVLRRVYGIEITPALVQREVRRIDESTRAPAMLAELKAALDNDPVRFARTVARPVLVDRLLRGKFADDDQCHALVRKQIEQARATLLTAKTNGASLGEVETAFKRVAGVEPGEIIWQLEPRPAGTESTLTEELEVARRFGPEARLLSTPAADRQDPKHYFDELPEPLQRVLRVQMRQPGDLSAVIELPDCFRLYLCRARTGATLNVAFLSLPKRGFEEWLTEQGSGVN
jgi:hypothetical protein